MTLAEIRHAIRLVAGPAPITQETYAATADRALLTIDSRALDVTSAYTLYREAERHAPHAWIDLACHRVAVKLHHLVYLREIARRHPRERPTA